MQFYQWWGASGYWGVSSPLLLSIVIATLLSNCRYSEFLTPLRFAIRCSAAGLAFYLVVEPPDFTLANPAAADLLRYVQTGYVAALGTAALSFFIPSFVLPTALYIFSTRFVVEQISGFSLSTLDIKYMVDMSVYLSLGGIAAKRLAPRIHPYLAEPERQLEVLAIGLALHLANYFWSGLAKLALGPWPWTWILENKTYNSVLFSAENGTLPLASIPWLLNSAYYFGRTFALPLNIAVVSFQLFAIACIWRRSWLAIASLAYDALHLGIYVLGGLFFWPWIWNNLTVLAAASKYKDDVFPIKARLACITSIILAGLIAGSARLAWFDVVDVRENYIVAVTPKMEARVPTSFFLSHSYAVSHGYFDNAPRSDQYPFTVWASSRDRQRNINSGTCQSPNGGRSETADELARRTAKVSQFLRAHHAKMLGRQSWPWWSFYARSHHHPSNPFLYTDFNNLNIKDVIGYKLVVQSSCLGIGPAGLTKKVLAEQEEYYDVN